MMARRNHIPETLLACVVLLGAGEPAHRVNVRVVTWNIAALSVDGVGVVETLRRLNPDVVALQEVDVDTRRSGNVDQARLLADALNLHASFGETMPYDGGHYGLAVLTRTPPVDVSILTLPRQDKEEPRIAMQVDLGFATLVNTHLTAAWHTRDPETLRLQQAQALARHLGTLPRERPLLLVGDFNCGAAEAPFAALRAVVPPVPNAQATWKDLVIDQVFFRAGRASVVQQSLHVEESNASDHKPVVLDLVMDLKTP